MSVWGIIVPINIQHPMDRDAFGTGRNNDDGLLLVRILVVSVGLAHDDVNLASWITGTAGPPFLRLD
jgi:hypothetical protein